MNKKNALWSNKTTKGLFFVAGGGILVATRSRHGSDNRTGLSFTTVPPLHYPGDPRKRTSTITPSQRINIKFTSVGEGLGPPECKYLLFFTGGASTLRFAPSQLCYANVAPPLPITNNNVTTMSRQSLHTGRGGPWSSRPYRSEAY